MPLTAEGVVNKARQLVEKHGLDVPVAIDKAVVIDELRPADLRELVVEGATVLYHRMREAQRWPSQVPERGRGYSARPTDYVGFFRATRYQVNGSEKPIWEFDYGDWAPWIEANASKVRAHQVRVDFGMAAQKAHAKDKTKKFGEAVDENELARLYRLAPKNGGH